MYYFTKFKSIHTFVHEIKNGIMTTVEFNKTFSSI